MASTSSPAHATDATYPSTFSAELIEHCKQGCVPPAVFDDALPLLQPQQRRRYVRVNPRCVEQVVVVGVEGVLRFVGLSARPVEPSPLTAEEQELLHTLPPHFHHATALDAPVSKKIVRDAVPLRVLLRLGVAGLTGLPLDAVQAVLWLPCGVFDLPWTFAMGSSVLFRNGTLLAMDAASIAAVVALRPRRGDRVLDLCCAPGMKLGLIADAVAADRHTSERSDDGCADEGGLAVGVDVSLPRLYMTRSTLKKQQGGPEALRQTPSTAPSSLPVCIFAGDGRSFCMRSGAASMDSRSATSAVVDAGTGLTARERRALQRCSDSGAKRARNTSTSGKTDVTATTARASTGESACAEADRDLSAVHVVYAPTPARSAIDDWQAQSHRESTPSFRSNENGLWLFDRVLVDAECSHDGSAAHVQLTDCREWDDASASASGLTIEKGRGITNEYRMRHLNLGLVNDSQSNATLCKPSTCLVADNKNCDDITGNPDNSGSFTSSLLELQSELLHNGYQQLKPNGTLVYATCSYAFTQNELVVRRFLDRVNSPAEKAKCGTATTAVVVPAFSYDHENGGDDNTRRVAVAPCVDLESEDAAKALQETLDAHALDYGVVQAGSRRYLAQDSCLPATPLGSRFWPRTFSCSFLYVAKVWKKVDSEE